MPNAIESATCEGSVASSGDAQRAVSLGTSHFVEANEKVREALREVDAVTLNDVFAQRYLGCAMPAGKSLIVNGVPGNDMACYMDGGYIEVFGNAQDQIGTTMNDGTVVVHGRCGDAAGYAMRGGTIFVRDDAGWRTGINMKQYKDKRPVIVIGGDAGSFLGEYMAGGIILLMGHAGEHIATGMHGGVIYLGNELPADQVPEGLVQEPLSEEDVAVVEELLGQYRERFPEKKEAPEPSEASKFCRLRPATSRPYASMYAN